MGINSNKSVTINLLFIYIQERNNTIFSILGTSKYQDLICLCCPELFTFSS